MSSTNAEQRHGSRILPGKYVFHLFCGPVTSNRELCSPACCMHGERKVSSFIILRNQEVLSLARIQPCNTPRDGQAWTARTYHFGLWMRRRKQRCLWSHPARNREVASIPSSISISHFFPPHAEWIRDIVRPLLSSPRWSCIPFTSSALTHRRRNTFPASRRASSLAPLCVPLSFSRLAF